MPCQLRIGSAGRRNLKSHRQCADTRSGGFIVRRDYPCPLAVLALALAAIGLCSDGARARWASDEDASAEIEVPEP
jgi:hypothetical protein